MDTEPSNPQPLKRRRKPLLVAALVLAVLAVAGVVGAVVVGNRNAGAPVAAVREYLDAIARGDAAAANALVDPKLAATDVDLDLLSNDMLAAAEHRIEIDHLGIDPAVDPTEETEVVVMVDYRLGSEQSFTTLRVERAGTTAGLLDDWRVVEPLLAAVTVETNVPTLGPARLGAVDVPTGSVYEDDVADRILVYPAVYPVRGARSRHVVAEPVVVAAQPADLADPRFDANVQVDYGPTDELLAQTTTRTDTQAAECATGSAPADARCPSTMTDAIAAGGANLRIDRPSSVREIVPARPHCDERACEFGVETSTGSFSYTDGDGAAKSGTFQLFARITLTPADEITIEFY
jgi:hypothetical protein